MTYANKQAADRGFTLVEVAVVLLIVALLIGGLVVPLGAQMDMRNRAETERVLAEALEGLLGYAAANVRLPCPASATSNGRASPESCSGQCVCTNPWDGFLPAVTLGLQSASDQGFATDGWGNRIRYAVTSQNAWAFTSVGSAGLKTAIQNGGFSILADPPSSVRLSVCASSTGVSGTDCGIAANTLSKNAVAVLISTGRNGASGSHGADEAANLDANGVFIFHAPSTADAANGEFDDMVTWLSPNLLYNRLIAAGQLP